MNRIKSSFHKNGETRILARNGLKFYVPTFYNRSNINPRPQVRIERRVWVGSLNCKK